MFSDYFQVRYFQIFSISKTTILRNFLLSAKDRENHKKKMIKKIFFDQKSRRSIFQITAVLYRKKTKEVSIK